MAETTITKQDKQSPVAAERAHQAPIFTPRVDIRETEAEVILVADMPGVDATSVNIDLEGSQLTVSGEFVPKAPDGYTLTYREYESGDYERSFTLGDSIDRNGIKAVVRNGVLRLTLSKAKEAKPQRITVKAG